MQIFMALVHGIWKKIENFLNLQKICSLVLKCVFTIKICSLPNENLYSSYDNLYTPVKNLYALIIDMDVDIEDMIYY